MTQPGIDVVNSILERRDPAPTGSGLLDAIGKVRFDKHDVRGCAHVASEALGTVDAEDPARPFLERIAATTCATDRDARFKMTGIFAACDEAVEACREPAPGR